MNSSPIHSPLSVLQDDLVRLLEDLYECTEVFQILEKLVRNARRLGLTNIRYYCRVRDGLTQWTSVDSVGDQMERAVPFRRGDLTKTEPDNPQPEEDPFFTVLAWERPLAFQLDSTTPQHPIRMPGPDEGDEGITVFLVRPDSYPEERFRPCWVELPLLNARSVVGKLTCDVEPGADLGAHDFAVKVFDFW